MAWGRLKGHLILAWLQIVGLEIAPAVRHHTDHTASIAIDNDDLPAGLSVTMNAAQRSIGERTPREDYQDQA